MAALLWLIAHNPLYAQGGCRVVEWPAHVQAAAAATAAASGGQAGPMPMDIDDPEPELNHLQHTIIFETNPVAPGGALADFVNLHGGGTTLVRASLAKGSTACRRPCGYLLACHYMGALMHLCQEG